MTRAEALAKIQKLQDQITKLRTFANSRCKHPNKVTQNDHDGWSVCTITYTTKCAECHKVLKVTKSDY